LETARILPAPGGLRDHALLSGRRAVTFRAMCNESPNPNEILREAVAVPDRRWRAAFYFFSIPVA
jgi:hypothetical protein